MKAKSIHTEIKELTDELPTLKEVDYLMLFPSSELPKRFSKRGRTSSNGKHWRAPIIHMPKTENNTLPHYIQ